MAPTNAPAGGKIAFILEPGGALGAYQAGALAALCEAGLRPNVIGGLSIGAINGALLAASPPDEAVERLDAFWTAVTTQALPFMPQMRRWNGLSSLLQGQHGFFRPRPPTGWMSAGPEASFYDLSELRATLTRLIDFDRLNRAALRCAVGATNVETGELAVFDTRTGEIALDHVLASGAIPPNFPAIEIGGVFHWDGALSATSLIEWLVEAEQDGDMLVFQIGLFRPEAPLPKGLDAISERKTDISSASRAAAGLRLAQSLERLRCRRRIDIVNLTYRPAAWQGRTKDFDFDRDAMRERWTQGHADAENALAKAPWRSAAPEKAAFRLFDVTRD